MARRGEPTGLLRTAPQRPLLLAGGRVEFVPDGDGRQGWTMLVDGVPSSHVDLDDPARLDFEYMRWTGDVVDLAFDDGAPVAAVHVGGAGCTLPRYVAATRPGSRQTVLEVDATVLDAARDALGLRSGKLLRLKVSDGRAGLADLPDASQDVVVRDAFDGREVPPHLTTTGFLREVRRVLAPDGVYVANVADSPRMHHARQEASTALGVFAHVVLAAEPGQFHGRRYGNVVLAASARDLPVAALGRRFASGAVRARLLADAQVRAFAAAARPLEDPPAA